MKLTIRELILSRLENYTLSESDLYDIKALIDYVRFKKYDDIISFGIIHKVNREVERKVKLRG